MTIFLCVYEENDKMIVYDHQEWSIENEWMNEKKSIYQTNKKLEIFFRLYPIIYR